MDRLPGVLQTASPATGWTRKPIGTPTMPACGGEIGRWRRELTQAQADTVIARLRSAPAGGPPGRGGPVSSFRYAASHSAGMVGLQLFCRDLAASRAWRGPCAGIAPRCTGLRLRDRRVCSAARFDCVLADAGYGSRSFRRLLSERGLLWAVGARAASSSDVALTFQYGWRRIHVPASLRFLRGDAPGDRVAGVGRVVCCLFAAAVFGLRWPARCSIRVLPGVGLARAGRWPGLLCRLAPVSLVLVAAIAVGCAAPASGLGLAISGVLAGFSLP